MEHTPSERVAAAIVEAMKRQGITLRSLADTTGIPLSTLHRSLAKGRPLHINELASITDALGTTVAAITAEVAA